MNQLEIFDSPLNESIAFASLPVFVGLLSNSGDNGSFQLYVYIFHIQYGYD
jgi:hypothetical protein